MLLAKLESHELNDLKYFKAELVRYEEFYLIFWLIE